MLSSQHPLRGTALYATSLAQPQAAFLEIMDPLTSDLREVAVYIYDILVSGTTASEHLQNLSALLQRLESKGLPCRLEVCLCRTLCGVPWSHPVWSKVNVMQMPAPVRGRPG